MNTIEDQIKFERRVTDIFHKHKCNRSHTDQCGYFYESWDKIGYSREQWLKEAKNFINKCNELGIDVDAGLELIGSV